MTSEHRTSPQPCVQRRHWPGRLTEALSPPQTTLWCNLEIAAQRFADQAALHFCGQTLSFGQLHQQSLALAGWLQSQGVQRGDRVALFMQNCPQYLTAFYALNRADAVAVPLNPMNKAQELARYLQDAGARGLICSADLMAVVEAANELLPQAQRLQFLLVTRYADALPNGRVEASLAMPPAMRDWLEDDQPVAPGAMPWLQALAAGLRPGPHQAQPDDLALLPYTSGTTGEPKGCMHSHRTLMANTCAVGLWGSASAAAVGLAVMPMFHITGFLYGVLWPVLHGASVVILPRWDRALAGRAIEQFRVTHWSAAPTMVVDLLAEGGQQHFDLSSLRYLSGGGSAMPAAVAERLKQRYGLDFIEGYGLTETAAPTHINPPERPRRQCLGIPIFGVDARIIDPSTRQELLIGEVGEIVSRGPMVFVGYWQRPEATEQAFVEIDGQRFFRTGDLGRMDEEGYFYLVDRLKRMINASGFKVWPSELELLLYGHPHVHEVCIVGARDAYRGETVKALVVLRAGAPAQFSAEELIAWMRPQVAAYKLPRRVEFVDALPKSASGKVLWRVLQERENA
jgi:fatty-acyl-CoA synthase